jgi:hypothetical protein
MGSCGPGPVFDITSCSYDWQSLEDEVQRVRQFIPPAYEQMSFEREEQKLSAAYLRAQDALKSTDCASLFNVDGSGIDPTALLYGLYVGDSNYGSITYTRQDMSIAASVSPGTPVNIKLNDDIHGLWGTGSTDYDAATLLHELGHAYEQLFGASSTLIVNDSQRADPNYPQKSIDNETLVRERNAGSIKEGAKCIR